MKHLIKSTVAAVLLFSAAAASHAVTTDGGLINNGVFFNYVRGTFTGVPLTGLQIQIGPDGSILGSATNSLNSATKREAVTFSTSHNERGEFSFGLTYKTDTLGNTKSLTFKGVVNYAQGTVNAVASEGSYVRIGRRAPVLISRVVASLSAGTAGLDFAATKTLTTAITNKPSEYTVVAGARAWVTVNNISPVGTIVLTNGAGFYTGNADVVLGTNGQYTSWNYEGYDSDSSSGDLSGYKTGVYGLTKLGANKFLVSLTETVITVSSITSTVSTNSNGSTNYFEIGDQVRIGDSRDSNAGYVYDENGDYALYTVRTPKKIITYNYVATNVTRTHVLYYSNYRSPNGGDPKLGTFGSGYDNTFDGFYIFYPASGGGED